MLAPRDPHTRVQIVTTARMTESDDTENEASRLSFSRKERRRDARLTPLPR